MCVFTYTLFYFVLLFLIVPSMSCISVASHPVLSLYRSWSYVCMVPSTDTCLVLFLGYRKPQLLSNGNIQCGGENCRCTVGVSPLRLAWVSLPLIYGGY